MFSGENLIKMRTTYNLLRNYNQSESFNASATPRTAYDQALQHKWCHPMPPSPYGNQPRDGETNHYGNSMPSTREHIDGSQGAQIGDDDKRWCYWAGHEVSLTWAPWDPSMCPPASNRKSGLQKGWKTGGIWNGPGGQVWGPDGVIEHPPFWREGSGGRPECTLNQASDSWGWNTPCSPGQCNNCCQPAFPAAGGLGYNCGNDETIYRPIWNDTTKTWEFDCKAGLCSLQPIDGPGTLSACDPKCQPQASYGQPRSSMGPAAL